MKKKHNYTGYDKWFEEYKPILNHFNNDPNGSWNGCMFETFGKEDEYITGMVEKEPNKVWTIMSDDYGFLVIVNGWHYVNRFGYFITEKPWADGDDFNVYDEDDIPKILRRERRSKNKNK